MQFFGIFIVWDFPIGSKDCGIIEFEMKSLEQHFREKTYMDWEVPKTLSLRELELAYQPYSLHLNSSQWLEIFQHRKNITQIEQYLHAQILNGCTDISYQAISHHVHCPRRYPLCNPSDKLIWKVSDKNLVSENKILLSSLPKVYYPTLILPHGYQLIDIDIHTAHLSILAMISGDEQLQNDVMGDIHLLVGKHLYPHFGPRMQRKIGKALNKVLPSGGSAHTIQNELFLLSKECSPSESSVLCIDITRAKSIYDWFWDYYPLAKQYGLWVFAHVKELRENGDKFRVDWDRRRLFEFNNYRLQGKVGVQDYEYDVYGVYFEKQHVLRSCFSAVLRGYERAMMDRIMLALSYLEDIHCFCPMYDGALLVVPNDTDLVMLQKIIDAELSCWSNLIRIKTKQIFV